MDLTPPGGRCEAGGQGEGSLREVLWAGRGWGCRDREGTAGELPGAHRPGPRSPFAAQRRGSTCCSRQVWQHLAGLMSALSSVLSGRVGCRGGPPLRPVSTSGMAPGRCWGEEFRGAALLMWPCELGRVWGYSQCCHWSRAGQSGYGLGHSSTGGRPLQGLGDPLT